MKYLLIVISLFSALNVSAQRNPPPKLAPLLQKARIIPPPAIRTSATPASFNSSTIKGVHVRLLNGDILGAVLRVHGADDHRNNFYAGGSAVACEITEREKEICAALKPWLQEKGLYFTGIDFLGDKLTEVNVTSPTCMQEMNRLYDLKLEDTVIAFVEKLIKSKRNSNA